MLSMQFIYLLCLPIKKMQCICTWTLHFSFVLFASLCNLLQLQVWTHFLHAFAPFPCTILRQCYDTFFRGRPREQLQPCLQDLKKELLLKMWTSPRRRELRKSRLDLYPCWQVENWSLIRSKVWSGWSHYGKMDWMGSLQIKWGLERQFKLLASLHI